MRSTKQLRAACYILIISVFVPLSVYPYNDQTTSERILRENKQFIHFLDVCISNFAENKEEPFKAAYEKHFNADVAYLQANYVHAYKNVRASQENLTKLYAEIVRDVYLEGAKNILDSVAPIVIRSKNARARLFLTLGYRDTTICGSLYKIGENSNPKLFSYKIHKFMKAIKYARRAKRYAFLSLFESQTPDVRIMIYARLIKAENDKWKESKKKGAGATEEFTPFFERFVDFFASEKIDNENFKKEKSKNFEEFEEERKKLGEKDTAMKSVSYEKGVERRVRFKNEKKVATYLEVREFDLAEMIMRRYIEDFNFKLAEATFEVLSAGKGLEAKDKVGLDKIDFNKLKVHLKDNYTRFKDKSLLETLYGKISAEDQVDEQLLDDDIYLQEEHSMTEEGELNKNKSKVPGKETKNK